MGIPSNLPEEEKEKLRKMNRDNLEKNREELKKIHSRNRAFEETKYPCAKEGNISLKCQTDFGQAACVLEIENFKQCQRFWAAVEKDRRKKGIKPHLPAVEDRKAVKKQYDYLVGSF